MIPLIIATYIYGSFLTAYLIGRAGGYDGAKSVTAYALLWPVIFVGGVWLCITLTPFMILFEALEKTAQSTRRRYRK
jgi:hypothetical protein